MAAIFLLRRAGGKQGRARLRDIAEHGHFLLRVTFHRLHQIRDQVGAALQHNVDLRPGCLHRLVLADQRILHAYVLAKNKEDAQYQNRYDDDDCDQMPCS